MSGCHIQEMEKRDKKQRSDVVNAVNLLLAMGVGGAVIALLALGVWKAIEIGAVLWKAM